MDKILNILLYSSLKNTWDINRIFQDEQYEGMIPLYSILKQYQMSVSKEEAIARHLHIISKITFGGILHLNDFEKIYSVKGTLYEIPRGALTYSKINVRHGCSYLNNTNNSILASSEYPSFIIDENKVYPKYLIMVLRCPQILKQFNSKLRGFTKSRVSVSEFLSTKIPLPSVEKQKKLVAEYEYLQNLATQKEEDAKKIENSIDEYWLSELEIENINNTEKKKILFRTINYKSLNKWVIDEDYQLKAKYIITTLDNVCNKITDGTHQTPEYINTGIKFLSAKDVTSQKISLSNIKYISQELHNQLKKRCLPQKDDILLAKNGTTGVAALFELDEEVSIYVSLALLRPNKDIINPKYLLYYINSKIAKVQFNRGLIGVGVPNLHLSVIQKTQIPLPTFNIQEKIIKKIDEKKEKICKLYNESEQLKQQAISNFEQKVFS